MINKHLFWLIVFVVEFSVNTANYAGGQSESCQSFDNSIRPYGVCPSINIKSIQSFKQLENCTVVEGYLQIAILHIPRDVVERLSFPDLREITDFLLIYRVTGLESFRNIFPNLSVIRGRQLFNFYSIVIYENRDLQELGLVNLRVISRGAIKFARNFKLCYIETVDWTQLGVHKLSIEFQKNNQQCPNTCKSECESKHCWSYYDCQKGFACGCKENQSCMENKTCCHEYCLGGCKGTTAEDCYSCKDVIFNNTCRPQCPPGTYTHLNRRCLTDRECLSLKNNSEGRSPKLLHGEKGEPNYCVYNCPQNYTSSESKEKNYTECVKCTEFCHKECNGLEITGIQDAQKLQGCSKIVGSLTIQILKGTAAAEDELEKSLGSIREITQVLTIKKSLVLYSLRFLKSLEIIGSASNGTSGIAFTLIDNQNLQELFPVDQMKKLKILNGRLHFYDNHQLCLHKIDEFVQYLNLTNVEGINRFTNGDQRPCLQDLLNLTVNVYSHTSVVLKWDKYKAEHRMLLTYILNYKEVSHLNDIPTVQYGRDSCSNDVWMTREYPPVDGPDTFQLGLLRELKPFTPYAVYVQAYTVTTATHSAMTDVITFKTLPFFPSEPRDLIAISENPNELRVKWKPPKAPNGIVKYYKIVYQKLELNEKPYNQRNYCTEKHYLPPKEKEVIRIDEEEKKFNYSKDCCKCPKSKEEEDDENQKRQVEIFFEDYLHKNIYCKRYDKLPEEVDNTLATISIDYIMEHSVGEELWRSIEERNNETSLNETLLAETLSIGGGFGGIDEGGGSLQEANNVSFTNVMEVEVYNSTEAVLPNLEHFSEYSIEVMACHDTNTNLSNGLKYCSIRAITLETTKPDWHMDLINESSILVEVEKNFTNRVYIKWDSPPKPNGLILNYLISYKKANQDNVVPQPLCVNRTEYLKNHGHRFKVIDYGNYSFKLSAVSLAGNDSYTQEKFFFVPKPPESESSSTLMIVVAVIGITLIVCIVVVAAFTYYRHKIPTGPTVISRNMNYVSSDYVYRPDEWEVSRDKIKLIKELGQGSFGMVYEGVAKGLSDDDPEEEIRVAVKTVNERASYSDKQEFLKEATIMKAFDCHHVVKLLGVVSKGQPNLVVMELMLLGDLKNYLRQLRPDEEHPDVIPPTLVDILQMAGEIADGMAYLADKKFVHRDLAARNCMVAEDRTVKIGDFGMTRDIYETDYYRKGGKGMLPVRWMAPESLKDGVFTSMSDVWSFGVVLWEMVTLAAQPYQGLSNEEVVRFVSDGCIMDMPENCPEDMAYLMRCCWEKKPNRRPTFKAVIRFLLPKLKPSFEKVSYYYSSGNTHDGSGDGILELFEGSDDASSNNSLSCEGAAAPRQSSLTRSSAGGNSHFKGSDIVFQYSDDIVPQNYIHNDDEEDSFNSEYGDDIDDSSLPFMPDSYVSTIGTRQPIQLSHQAIENDTSLHNSGLIELKPLINKDKSLGTSSPRLFTVQQSTSPRLVTVQQSSDYLGHQPPTLKTEMEPLHGNHSLPQNNPPYQSTADPLRSASPSTGASSQQLTRHHTPGALAPRPNLRLPTLNQTAVAALYNVSLLNSGDKDKNSDLSRNSQFCSSDQSFSQTAAPLSTVDLVHIENGLGASTATSPSLPDQHYSSSIPGAIASNSSDGSKESTKSSESYSLRNGLTNGHIYLPSDRHRTAHC